MLRADCPLRAGSPRRGFWISAGHGPHPQKSTPLSADSAFRAVFDTNFAADLTVIEEAAEFVERFTKQSAPLPLITSCCPAWVDYMEKRFSDFIPNFSTAKSPQQMMGVLAKTYFAEVNGVDPDLIYQVSIMPCTAKKFELERTEEMYASGHKDVDVALTTRELARMIKQSGVDFRNLPDGEADSILGTYSGAGLIFGNTGGVMEAALRTAYFNITGENLTADAINICPVRGLNGVKEATVEVAGDPREGGGGARAPECGDGPQKKCAPHAKRVIRPPYHFIEVMACPGGCIGGGGQPYGISDELRRQRMQGLLDGDGSMELRFSHENPGIQKLYTEFLGGAIAWQSARSLAYRLPEPSRLPTLRVVPKDNCFSHACNSVEAGAGRAIFLRSWLRGVRRRCSRACKSVEGGAPVCGGRVHLLAKLATGGRRCCSRACKSVEEGAPVCGGRVHLLAKLATGGRRRCSRACKSVEGGAPVCDGRVHLLAKLATGVRRRCSRACKSVEGGAPVCDGRVHLLAKLATRVRRRCRPRLQKRGGRCATYATDGVHLLRSWLRGCGGVGTAACKKAWRAVRAYATGRVHFLRSWIQAG